jgi:hypothetical protein
VGAGFLMDLVVPTEVKIRLEVAELTGVPVLVVIAFFVEDDGRPLDDMVIVAGVVRIGFVEAGRVAWLVVLILFMEEDDGDDGRALDDMVIVAGVVRIGFVEAGRVAWLVVLIFFSDKVGGNVVVTAGGLSRMTPGLSNAFGDEEGTAPGTGVGVGRGEVLGPGIKLFL